MNFRKNIASVMRVLFWVVILIVSCKSKVDFKDQKLEAMEAAISKVDIVFGNLDEQDRAFAALNTLQLNMDGHHLYSTFSGIAHNCNRFDSMFVITQADLRIALDSLVVKYGTDISVNEQSALLDDAVLAQENYIVKRCYGSKMVLEQRTFKKVFSPNLEGTWVLPEVLGEGDVVIIW